MSCLIRTPFLGLAPFRQRLIFFQPRQVGGAGVGGDGGARGCWSQIHFNDLSEGIKASLAGWSGAVRLLERCTAPGGGVRLWEWVSRGTSVIFATKSAAAGVAISGRKQRELKGGVFCYTSPLMRAPGSWWGSDTKIKSKLHFLGPGVDRTWGA